jgi:transcriptional regulator with XRE-family HTH domain
MRTLERTDEGSPQLVSGFLDSIQEPRTPFISPRRFAGRAGLRMETLARLAGVHRNTVSQNPGSEPLQRTLRGLVKAIAAATALTGDVDRAIYWLVNEPIADYRHQTAAELIAGGHLEAVLAYIEDLAGGATG